jgi:hypothetical protein
MSIRIVVLPPGQLRAAWPFKAPDEVLDYGVDWSRRLAAGDAIAGTTFMLPPGLVATRSSYADASTEVWISGGVQGETYRIQNRITTSAGRIMDQTIRLKVKSK